MKRWWFCCKLVSLSLDSAFFMNGSAKNSSRENHILGLFFNEDRMIMNVWQCMSDIDTESGANQVIEN